MLALCYTRQSWILNCNTHQPLTDVARGVCVVKQFPCKPTANTDYYQKKTEGYKLGMQHKLVFVLTHTNIAMKTGLLLHMLKYTVAVPKRTPKQLLMTTLTQRLRAMILSITYPHTISTTCSH